MARDAKPDQTPGTASEGSLPAGPENFPPANPVCRDLYSDVERAPSALVNKEDGWYYEMNVSTLADEYAGEPYGRGWVQRTSPLGSKGNPIETAGTAGATDDGKIIPYREGDDSPRRSRYSPGSGDQGPTG